MYVYTQCKLVHKESGRIDIAWIPNSLATFGKQLRFKLSDGWEDGWSVMEIYSSASKKQVIERSKDYRKMSTFDKGE